MNTQALSEFPDLSSAEDKALKAAIDLLQNTNPDIRLRAAVLILVDFPLAKHNMQQSE